MSAKYDPRIIREFANRLYAQATITLVLDIILFAIIGASVGLGFLTMPNPSPIGIAICSGISALIGGLIGFLIGNNAAFHLRLQAQLALCQLKTEENTRRGGVEDNNTEILRRPKGQQN